MELIQFNKNGGSVTIEILFQGVNIWSYEYVGDRTFRNNSASGRETTHSLGAAIGLDNDINSWDIRFGNISGEEAPAAVTINWKQDGQVLNTWSKQVQVPAESAIKISEDALLIGNILTEAV